MRLIKEEPRASGSPETSNPGNWTHETLRILRSRNSKIFFAVVGGLVVLRLGSNWIFKSRQHDEIPRVTITKPEVGSMDQTLSLPGNIEAIEQASLFAHVNGYLKKIYVDEGDTVKKGQLLAEIDAPDVVQEFNKAKAEFNLKNVTDQRYRELLKEKVVSEQEFDNVDAEANEAKARFDNAAANLSFTHIVAPFSGAIARRFKYPGDLISSNSRTGSDQPLFILVNEKSLRVAINVPQIEVAKIHPADRVDIRVDAYPNRKFEGVVSRLDDLLDDATKTQRVLIDLNNADGSLHAGMFATAILHIKDVGSAISVPKDCILNEGDKNFVFLAKDGKAYRQEVKLGMELGTRVQVIEGIKPTDSVVWLGSAVLKDGSPIIAQPQAQSQ
jgi:RND family efflux transporter MFP subunit